MNNYDVILSRVIKGIRNVNEFYVIVTEDNEVFRCNQLPASVPSITLDKMADAFYESCRDHLTKFAASEDNKDVYAISVYTDYNHLFAFYVNTLEGLGETYKNNSDVKYDEASFEYIFEIFNDEFELMREGYITAYHTVFDSNLGYHLPEYVGDFKDIKCALENIIFQEQSYFIALETAKRLKEFDIEQLNTTEDFVIYAKTGQNEGLDYSLTMRQTVPLSLLYRIFPEIQTGDEQFEQLKAEARALPLKKQIEYWLKEFNKERHGMNHNSKIVRCLKSDYEAVLALVENGVAIIPELYEEFKTAFIESDDSKESNNRIYFLNYTLGEFTLYPKEMVDDFRALLSSEEVQKINEYTVEDIKQTFYYMQRNQDF
ncbi:hypothetical protein [Paenibacillus agilis]|uniref:DUF4303 domain-containing protein n=1 Tax=Paenibacillus agilis TaxID=3020863 RepID=A0A559J126_9BACL|nr:hypothetical protein [Paenibacillus agilis]TVX93595.1 hypothetical protein FPZ44_11320 [Paenibacillus agilis]